MEIYGKTDIGIKRHSNQDAFLTKRLNSDTALAIVCDGMGGANAGNVASESAVKIISEYVERSYREDMSDSEIEKMLKNAIVSANISVYDMSLKNSALEGMGTTAAVAIVRGDSAIIAHVGDSRAYIAGEALTQLTRDHSVVQSLLESGKITAEDAKVHPRKNVITRALGVEENIVVDSCQTDFAEGNGLLLCTDGLTNYAEEADILNILNNTQDSLVPEELIKLANANGGGDNITVVTVTR